MSRVLVLVDPQHSINQTPSEFKSQIVFRTRESSNPDIKLSFSNIRPALPSYLSSNIADLLVLAAVCYEADESVSRGGCTQLLDTQWVDRHITIEFPVSDATVWSREDATLKLERYLAFISGHKWSIHISQGRPSSIQTTLFNSVSNTDRPSQVDAVSLFSGGLDSFTGAVNELSQGKRIALASHYTIGSIARIQNTLGSQLSDKYGDSSFIHIRFNSSSRGSNHRTKEESRRARGFIFHSLALAVALGTDAKEILVPENGVAAINLAYRAQSILARNSRASHPVALNLFQQFASALCQRSIIIRNPLKYTTRVDTLKILEKEELDYLVDSTVSCVGSRFAHQPVPHCGICSQCIDRRFALEHVRGDSQALFRHNIFHDKVDWESLMAAVDYVDAAKAYTRMGMDEFLLDHPDMHDVLDIDISDMQAVAQEYYDMYSRHSRTVLTVMNNQIAKADLASSGLTDDALVRVIAGHDKNRYNDEFIESLTDYLKNGLIHLVKWPNFTDENDVQNNIESLLDAKWRDIIREKPLLPFSGFGFKPDFSKSNGAKLFIEVKYPRSTRKPKAISDEIVVSLAKYRKSKAFGYFVIVDPLYEIRDRLKFVQDMELGCTNWLRFIP